MKFKSDQTYDKLRGGYYTPVAVARFLSRWALGGDPRSLLEPSCGDGAFFRAIEELGLTPDLVHGVELDPVEANKAQLVLGVDQPDRRVFATDFLQFAEDGQAEYDAVLGNPPYIRYQFLSAETQHSAKVLYDRNQLPFTKHLNAWAPFVVESLDRLAPGGRLAMVVPAELMNVIHAGGLRKFLLEVCSRVLLIDTQSLMFEEALQGTVLLMAQKRSASWAGPAMLAIQHETGTAFLERDPTAIFENAAYVERAVSYDKWMSVLLTEEERSVLERAKNLPALHRFGDVATVGVGIVTGANNFFLVPDDVVEEFDLHQFVKPMFGRSAHVRGVVYSQAVHAANKRAGLATNFLDFGNVAFADLPIGAQRYIQRGEGAQLHTRYKCRIREPWYDVPSVRFSTMSLLKRSHEVPRLIVNEMSAYTTDTAYRVDSEVDPAALAVGWFNSLTALSAELSGRAYGGGVLELVPSEIREVLVPLVHVSADDLADLDAWFHSGEGVDTILERQDLKVLVRAGLTPDEVVVVQRARRRLMARRLRLVSGHDQSSASEAAGDRRNTAA